MLTVPDSIDGESENNNSNTFDSSLQSSKAAIPDDIGAHGLDALCGLSEPKLADLTDFFIQRPKEGQKIIEEKGQLGRGSNKNARRPSYTTDFIRFQQ